MVEKIGERERKLLEGSLVINEDDLDACLIEQPQLFLDAADSVALAIADRDAIKLELDELTAELDKKLRDYAAHSEEKLTEASLQRKLSLEPKIQAKQREFADKRLFADRWLALKEAYKERSWMLREVVGSKISQMQNLSIERGSHGVRRNLIDAQSANNSAEQARMRSIRRGGDNSKRSEK